MALTAVQNKATAPKKSAPKKSSQPNNEPLFILQAQLAELTKVVSGIADHYDKELAARDERLTQLEVAGIARAGDYDRLQAAYQAQGEVIERQAEALVALRIDHKGLFDAYADTTQTTSRTIETLAGRMATDEGLTANVGELRAEIGAVAGRLDRELVRIAEQLATGHAAAQEAVVAARHAGAETLQEMGRDMTARYTALQERVQQVEGGLGTLERADAAGAVRSLIGDVRALEERFVVLINERREHTVNLAAELRDNALNLTTDTRAEIARLRLDVDEHVATIETAAGELRRDVIAAAETQERTIRKWVADVVDDANDALQTRDAEIEKAAAVVSEHLAALTGQCNVVRLGTERELAAVREALEEARSSAAADVAGVRSALQDVRERLRSTVSALPKSLMVDRDGDLVAIDGNGDSRTIARVAGRDGRDGAELLDAGLRDGCLVLQMTNGRKVTTENVVQQVLQQVQQQVVDNLLKAGASATQIKGIFGNRSGRSKKAGDEGQSTAARPARRK